jgi:phosphohistidine phosphatase
MQRLILLRHAKAESVPASGGDFERALTERGRRDAALIGRVLAEAGYLPDLVLVSPARRAAQTWDEVARAFPDARVKDARSLYLATSEQIADLVDGAGEHVGALMIVGHNPGLHELALSLATAASATPAADAVLTQAFPTAAAAVFDVDSGGRLAFRTLLLPRDHGGGAG